MARIAILIDQMFEDSELRVPYDRLREAGHEVELVGVQAGTELAGKQGAERITTEKAARDVKAAEYDALVIPGGYSPDHLRMDIHSVRLTRDMAIAGKPVAAVCHGPWMLVEADVADGRTLTSWPSLKTDLVNAGARWVDRPVVVDGNIITSRKPDDLQAFCDAILRELDEGVPERGNQPLAPDATSQERPTTLH